MKDKKRKKTTEEIMNRAHEQIALWKKEERKQLEEEEKTICVIPNLWFEPVLKILKVCVVLACVCEIIIIILTLMGEELAGCIFGTVLLIVVITMYLWIYCKSKTIIYAKKDEVVIKTLCWSKSCTYEEIRKACERKSVRYKMSCWYVPLTRGWLKLDVKNEIGDIKLEERLYLKCGIELCEVDGRLYRLWKCAVISACIIASGLWIFCSEIIGRVFLITDFLSIQNIIQTMMKIDDEVWFYGGLGTVAVGLFFYMLLIPLQAMELRRRGLNVKMKL